MNAPALIASAIALSALGVALLRRFADRLPHARPGTRTMHERPVPRVGGLAILLGAAPALVFAPPPFPDAWTLWLACVATVAAVSLADDVRGVPAALRLAVHLAASGTVALLLLGSSLAAVGAAIAIAWSANLYNFMDGSDGLAAVMAITGFGAYAVVAWHAGAEWVLYAALVAATLPFLAANRPPAAIFMGDVGAVPLGFLAGALGAAGAVQDIWPAWLPVLAFLPFVADATATLALRFARGERVWEAHRSHFYQRLNLAGAGHRGTLAIYAAAMLGCALLAVACAVARPAAGWLALAVAALFHAAGFCAIAYHVRNKARGTTR